MPPPLLTPRGRSPVLAPTRCGTMFTCTRVHGRRVAITAAYVILTALNRGRLHHTRISGEARKARKARKAHFGVPIRIFSAFGVITCWINCGDKLREVGYFDAAEIADWLSECTLCVNGICKCE
eukprot:IDg6223t1